MPPLPDAACWSPWAVLACWALGPASWAALVGGMLPWNDLGIGLVATSTSLALALTLVVWLLAGSDRFEVRALRTTWWLLPMLFLLQPPNTLGGSRGWIDAMQAGLFAVFVLVPFAVVWALLAQLARATIRTIQSSGSTRSNS